AQLAVPRPLDERHLHDDLRSHPVPPATRQAVAAREGAGRLLQRVEALAQLEQQTCVEAGADLAREDEVGAGEEADQQRAQADETALRLREAADDQLLAGFALHLEPGR